MSETPVHFLDVLKEYPAPEFPVKTIPPESWKNGMVVRMPNHLGDAVMALPALAGLRKIVPRNCALYVICPNSHRAFYRSLPMVDGILGLANLHSSWSRSEKRNLYRMRMGVGVLFNNSFRDAFLMRTSGVRVLFGASARCRSWLLRRSFEFPPRPKHQPANLHHANRYLAIARALGAPAWDGKLPEFRILPPVDELSPVITALCEHPRLMTLGSGAAYGAAKRWPAESYRKVAEHWIARGGVAAVLGSAEEMKIGEEIVAGLDPRKIFNLSGKTSMPELMHLLANSAVTIANDSGIMHLSAAFDRPGIAIFGPTDYTATGPICPNWHLFYLRNACPHSPCFCRVCPQNRQACIKAITPEMVISELDKMEH